VRPPARRRDGRGRRRGGVTAVAAGVAVAAAAPLPPGAVHLAWVPVGATDTDLAHDRALLGADESARADGYARADDRDGFIRHRAGLRRLLAGYLGTAPQDVRFALDPGGRPRVASPAPNDLRFSTARRGALALVAVARDLEVGVDVEVVRRDLPVAALAAHALDPAAHAAVTAAADPVRAFFDAWTQLEAGLKVAGVGLAEAERRRAAGDPVAPPPFVSRVDAGPGAVAALAASGVPLEVVVVAGLATGHRMMAP
jgi:4'-phosphopantetheinyl transferase